MTMRGLCAVLLVTAFFVAFAQADAFTDRINKMKAAGENISAFNFGKQRLIKTSEEDPGQWMLGLEISKLQEEKTGFIDVTDVPFPISALGDAPVPPPLPDQPQQKQLVQSLNSKLSTTSFRVNVEHLSSYYTRYYTTQTGAQAAEWIYNTLNTYKGDRTDIEVQFFNNSWVQSSVIARFPGTVSTDVVILGCHLDSVHLGGIGRAPGVDDDGSGVVTNLDIFRVLASNNFKPNRTLEIHFYSAEEVGLLGSREIAQSYLTQGKNVVGMLQLDMTFFHNNTNIIGLVTDHVSSDLTAFVRLLVDAYSILDWQNTLCGYSCSDHASWTEAGYRSVFPFESIFEDRNPFIHSTKDTLANADLDHGLEFAKVALGFAVELSATVYTTAQ
eukprot:TRINITY_DN2715_c0_g1_i4.p1 TRINITY_DN2715_c0_g1~~TRINITY_DN2715_c0_g1_i4.p1  ORF type:complete len:394 (-),score=177.03 TRINITY_DN2715_c0_g1_i4:52-1209(-)